MTFAGPRLASAAPPPRLMTTVESPPPPPGTCDWPHPRGYPASISVDLLVRRNRFRSAVLIAVMITLGVVLAAGIAVLIAWLRGKVHSPASAVPPLLEGASLGLALAVAGSLWSWFRGAKAIVSMCVARPLMPDEHRTLFEIVHKVSGLAGIPAPKLFVIEDSALNAFSTGRSPGVASLVVTRGLLNGLPPAELEAVVAHEVAHIRHLDTRFAMLMATMVGLIVFACDGCCRIAFQAGKGSHVNSGSAKYGAVITILFYIIAGLLAVISPIIAIVLQWVISREREHYADAGAVALGQDPGTLASALEKLARDTDPLVDTANRATAHLFIVNPLEKMRGSGQMLDSVFCSHPPIDRRVQRLLAMAIRPAA